MTKSLPWLRNWPNKLIYLFLITICCLLYTHLGRDPLFDWDEGIYGELGRELLTRGNLLTSSWNGAAWFEKPPGLAWTSALGMLLAGVSPFGARLLMPLLSTLTLYLVYRLGSRLGGWRQGLIAAGVLATFDLFLGRSRAVNADMPLLAGITATVLALVANKRPLVPSLAIAASIWFKGPAGLLSALIPLPLFLSKPKNYVLSTMYYVLAFTLPWHLYSYLRFGREFVTPYLFEQVLRRVAVPIEFHMESRWFYLNYLYTNLGLGVLLVAAIGAFSLFVRMFIYKKSRLIINHQPLTITLLWWVFVPLAIFTLAKTRLFWYILPVYPALSLMVSEAIVHITEDKRSRLVVAVLAVGIMLQGVLSTARSVELAKKSAPLSDRLQVASALAGKADVLAVLVPPSERRAEALLPKELRLSSSFRYGGMPSVVFYYRGRVQFFYNLDEFSTYWRSHPAPLALLSREDLSTLDQYQIISETATYVGVTKGDYAHR